MNRSVPTTGWHTQVWPAVRDVGAPARHPAGDAGVPAARETTMTRTRTSEERWLSRLYALNAVIAAQGAPLEGNLFYVRYQDGFADQPPAAIFAAKRRRVVAACKGRERLLEIGVNGCHSAYLVLSTNPNLTYFGVDICDHPYVQPAAQWLQAEFPGRVHFFPGDSQSVLRRLAASGYTFDAFHIDGSKRLYFRDITLCSTMVGSPDAVVIVDDSEQLGVRVALRGLRGLRVVRGTPAFPAMSRHEPERNTIGRLEPSSGAKLTVLAMAATALDYVRASKRSARALLAGTRSHPRSERSGGQARPGRQAKEVQVRL